MKLDERRALRTEVSRFITASCLSAFHSPFTITVRPGGTPEGRIGREWLVNEVTRRLSSGAPSFPTADRLDVGHFASSIPFLPRSERSEWSTGERSEPDMEEEIIGNRWKELDYDGHVPAAITPNLLPSCSSVLHSLPSVTHYVPRSGWWAKVGAKNRTKNQTRWGYESQPREPDMDFTDNRLLQRIIDH